MISRLPQVAASPVIEITGLGKTFPGQVALSGFDLSLRPGEVHALVGENGSGKSTLIKCLSGYHVPDDGFALAIKGAPVAVPYRADQAAGLGLLFVHQDLGIVPSLSVMENVALGSGFATRNGSIRWDEQAAVARRQLARLGREDITVDLPARRLSASSQATVAIARTLACALDDASLVVLDEPTAALPEAEVETLFGVVRRLAATGVAVLFVSHRLREVFALADRVTVLRDARKVGTFEVIDLDERKLVELIVGRVLRAMPSQSSAAPRDDVVLRTRGLAGNRLADVTLDAHAGEILGIAGLQGSGRSELMRLLYGAQRRTAGVIELAGRPVTFRNPAAAIRAGLSLVPEDRRNHGALGRMTVAENISLPTLKRFSRGGRLRRRPERDRVIELIREFDVQPPDPDRLICRLSGGNQQKAILAKWVETNPRVLLLDEPVQGVDVGSKSEIWTLIERIVERRGMTVIVTSSDFEDLQRICHRVLVLRGGRIAAELEGATNTVEHMTNHAYLTEAAA